MAWGKPSKAWGRSHNSFQIPTSAKANVRIGSIKKNTPGISSGQRSAAAVRAAQARTQNRAAAGSIPGLASNYRDTSPAANLPAQIAAKNVQTNANQTAINATTLANQAKVAAIASQVANAAKAAQLAAALKGTIQAKALAGAAINSRPTPSGPVSVGSTGGSAGAGSVGGTAGPVATPATVSPPVIAPPVVAPPVASGPGSTNVAGGSFTSKGRGITGGRLERQRLNRGPRTGLSITPEMLQAIARRRVGRT